MKGVRIFYLIVASWNQAMQVELIYDEQFPSCFKILWRILYSQNYVSGGFILVYKLHSKLIMALDCYTIYLDLTIIHLFVNLFHAAIVKKSLKCFKKSWTMDQKNFQRCTWLRRRFSRKRKGRQMRTVLDFF